MQQSWSNTTIIRLFNLYKNTNKIIINVGSRIAEDGITLTPENYHLLEYQIYKKALKTLSYDLHNLQCTATIKYIWFGYVGTDAILKKYPDLKNYITLDDAASQILGLINV